MLADDRRRAIIDDVMEFVCEFEKCVRDTLDSIAAYFLERLAPIPRMYPCGTFLARIYIRMVAPDPNLTIHSGHCASWDWFETEREFFCPLAERCGAYQRKWPGGYAAAVGADSVDAE